MTSDDGLLDRSKCMQIFCRSSSGSFRPSKASASLHADGGSSLNFFAAFTTSAFGPYGPENTPSLIHRTFIFSRSALWAVLLHLPRISYKEPKSSSYVLLRVLSCSFNALACRSARSKWHANSMTSGSIFMEAAFSRSYSRACCCVMVMGGGGNIPIMCGGGIPIGGTWPGTMGGGTCCGIGAWGGSLGSGARRPGCFSSSSLIFSIISPASISLNFAAPSSPFSSASFAAASILMMSSLRCLYWSWISCGTLSAPGGRPLPCWS
mmetsp:Transcript_32679/g.90132  ORF Transcript_32679/g.90132 Transcript_32679/m.90132 type:complete len:265 (-) Transcript_32679:337-1131(-)